MSRYIDADKLALKWMLASPKQKETFRQIIDEEPTADIAPIVHGEWTWDGRVKRCSICGVTCPEDEYNYMHPNYCGNCGARMAGDT